MDLEKKIYKSKKNKMLGGVCGGIGEYFKIDPTLVRLGFVALCICAGGGIIAYIVALIIIPEAPEGYESAAQETSQETARPTAEPAAEGTPEASDSTGPDSPTQI